MRIESSAVAMQSQRAYSSIAHKQSASIVSTAQDAAILDFSDESKSLIEQLEENKIALKKKQSEENGEGSSGWMSPGKINETNGGIPDDIDDLTSMKLQMLRKLLEALNKMNRAKYGVKSGGITAESGKNQLIDSINRNIGNGVLNGISAQNADTGSLTARTSSAGTVWKRTTVESAFFAEQENTAFQTQGIVKTTDGRQIGFNVSVEMSRAFEQEYESISQSSYVMSDPLIINLDTDAATLTEEKFLFDLNSDGEKEEMSFAGKGSGFLAYDKNNDGIVNDGSELFGTKSGDGFKDLASYDEDGNGWLDENDSIYNKLKIWFKDEDGNDSLLSLKNADVGAIYLGAASTQFSINNVTDNETNGVIRKTGVYLKESTGEAGTVQHVDLAI